MQVTIVEFVVIREKKIYILFNIFMHSVMYSAWISELKICNDY